MFTGIVEEIGSIQSIQKGRFSSVLSIEGKIIFRDIHIGDSIAVNGVCLTVTAFEKNVFQADVMPETLSRSSLGALAIGSPVNLERAMPANGRFGGHIVSGHIDGTGYITDIKTDQNSVWFTIQTPLPLLRYLIEKGSIAIDGISLTIAKLGQDTFRVSIIPHSLDHTILSTKRVGEVVNLETDCIGKYVERLLDSDFTPSQKQSTITRDFLTKIWILGGALCFNIIRLKKL